MGGTGSVPSRLYFYHQLSAMASRKYNDRNIELILESDSDSYSEDDEEETEQEEEDQVQEM